MLTRGALTEDFSCVEKIRGNVWFACAIGMFRRNVRTQLKSAVLCGRAIPVCREIEAGKGFP